MTACPKQSRYIDLHLAGEVVRELWPHSGDTPC